MEDQTVMSAVVFERGLCTACGAPVRGMGLAGRLVVGVRVVWVCGLGCRHA